MAGGRKERKAWNLSCGSFLGVFYFIFFLLFVLFFYGEGCYQVIHRVCLTIPVFFPPIQSLICSHYFFASTAPPQQLFSRSPRFPNPMAISHSLTSLASQRNGRSLSAPPLSGTLPTPPRRHKVIVHEDRTGTQEAVNGAPTELATGSVFTWDCSGNGALYVTFGSSKHSPDTKLLPDPNL